MQVFGTGSIAWLLSSALLFSCPVAANTAQASQVSRQDKGMIRPSVALNGQFARQSGFAPATGHAARAEIAAGKRVAARSFGISCVPYARQVSGIMVVGNAWQWWDKAEGHYARGEKPEIGSVLNFRANGRMTLGHVAVVKRIVNAREVIIDHANWPSGSGLGTVSRNVAVVDISEANNWSAVRVELAVPGTFGSVYPTYGFIYNRPDSGFVTASITRPAPLPDINPVPSDLRPQAQRGWRLVKQVADTPNGPGSGFGEPVSGIFSNP